MNMAAQPVVEKVQIMHVAAEPEFQESTSYVRSYWPCVNKLQLILRRFTVVCFKYGQELITKY